MTDADVERVRAIGGDENLLTFIANEIEENCDEDWCADTDKAWEAIHRAFSDSTLDYDFDAPLKGVVLGGEPLTESDDYVVSFKTGEQVRAINDALQPVTREEFEMAYRRIDPKLYDFPMSDEDLAYSWDGVGELKAFYARAAAAGRAVIFTA